MRSLRTFARSARQVHRGAVRFASTEEKAAAGQSRRGGGFAGPFFLGAVAGSGALYVAVTQGLLPVGPAPAPTSTTTSRQPTPPTPVDYARVRSEIAALISEDDNRGPLFVRLAWHCAGTFDKSTGKYGSNGATMRFHPEADHGANAGLHLAREMLEPIKTRNPGITYADLYTLCGAVAVEELGGPAIPWKPGRADSVSGENCPPDGNLPDASKDERHVRDIFYRMGFDDREIVALVGAHTLGRCHTDRSGYSGPWTRAPTTFSNMFFKELKDNKWTKKKWTGPEQFEDPSGELMMLPSDMAMLFDKKFKVWVEKYAEDEEAFFRDFASAFGKLLALGCPPVCLP